MLCMDCPGLPSQEGCLSNDSDAPAGNCHVMHVTGQPAQSKLHTAAVPAEGRGRRTSRPGSPRTES